MKEVADALVKVQVALENDTEVLLGQIERSESVLDQTARHYVGMLNITDQAEQQATLLQESKQEAAQLIADLDKVEHLVAHFESLAKEIDEWSSELDVKSKRIKQI